MHYFKLDIKATREKTLWMSEEELGFYMKILWFYYASESPIKDNLEEIFEILKTKNKKKKLIIEKIFLKNFTKSDDFFIDQKIEDEIKKYKENKEINKKNGLAHKKSSSEDGKRIACEALSEAEADGNPNILIYESINLLNKEYKNKINTNTENKNKDEEEFNKHITRAGDPPRGVYVHVEEPMVAKKPRAVKKIIDRPNHVSEDVWDEFAIVAKNKKYVITKIGLEKIGREAEAANITLNDALKICVERGWKSFEAEWILKNHAGAVGEMKRNFKGDFIGMSHHDSLMLENEMAIQEAVRLFNLREGIEK